MTRPPFSDRAQRLDPGGAAMIPMVTSSTPPPPPPPPSGRQARQDSEGRPFADLGPSGLLWLINRVVFHPRGYALALIADADGTVAGWDLLGDGVSPYRYAHEEDDNLARAEATLHAQQHPAQHGP